MKALFGRLKKIFLAGKGRPVAAGILLWMLFASLISEADLPAWWSGSLPGQAMEIAAHPFKAGRQFLFDGYQRTFPRQPESQPVTLVAIDEQSLKPVSYTHLDVYKRQGLAPAPAHYRHLHTRSRV